MILDLLLVIHLLLLHSRCHGLQLLVKVIPEAFSLLRKKMFEKLALFPRSKPFLDSNDVLLDH